MHIVKFLLLGGVRFVIVSRHSATLAWLAAELGGQYIPGSGVLTVPDKKGGTHLIAVITGNAMAQDVKDAHVIGNLPLSLASYAKRVFAVEFTGIPPRGQEYTLEEMVAAGVKLMGYSVERHYHNPEWTHREV